MAQHQQSHHQHEFLPLCDVLFNIISLASYFCDVVFDLAMGYALANYSTAPPALFPISIVLIVTSLLISQIVSIRWYLWGARGKLTIKATNQELNFNGKKKLVDWKIWCVVFLHSTQMGVLWRYFKLFIPVDLTYVKHEVRELCVLRLIHAFCEAAPMLLLQLYLLSIGVDDKDMREEKRDIFETQNADKLIELTTVSAGLSLWSVCWAVASFSKGAARLRNLERLVLTWLGVLAQLAWRLGTVSARIGALVAYSSLYGGQWLIIVLALHWLSMLTWLLLTPDGLFHGGERLSLARKTFLASLLAFVYVFAYVNLHETNHRQKMLIFYAVMFLENSLLIGIWAVGVNGSEIHHLKNHPRPFVLVLTLVAFFFGGLCFMGLYYRFFHVRRLQYEAGGRMNGTDNDTNLSNHDNSNDKHIADNDGKKITNAIGTRNMKINNNGIPGVFNCRFANPAVVNLNRKKKKPTTFVPPPPSSSQGLADSKSWTNGNNTRQTTPFWKRPLSISENNEESGDEKNNIDAQISSLNVNLIREKLREKKQQQLRELRAIQEEIKEGKLVPPPSASTSSFSSSLSATNQQQPPNTKLHTSPNPPSSTSPLSLSDANASVLLTSWPPVKMHCLLPPSPTSFYHPTIYPSNTWRGPVKCERSSTPEILLAPRCLPHHYPHWTPIHRLETNQNDGDDSSKGEPAKGDAEISDMDSSQVSLPRNYSPPREFQYNNSNNLSRELRFNVNKTPSSRFYLPSTNSSDGDVDSADNEEETDSELQGNMNHAYNLNQDENLPRRLNNGAIDQANSMNENMATSMGAVYFNNSHGSRVNQLLKPKVKHETKL